MWHVCFLGFSEACVCPKHSSLDPPLWRDWHRSSDPQHCSQQAWLSGSLPPPTWAFGSQNEYKSDMCGVSISGETWQGVCLGMTGALHSFRCLWMICDILRGHHYRGDVMCCQNQTSGISSSISELVPLSIWTVFFIFFLSTSWAFGKFSVKRLPLSCLEIAKSICLHDFCLYESPESDSWTAEYGLYINCAGGAMSERCMTCTKELPCTVWTCLFPLCTAAENCPSLHFAHSQLEYIQVLQESARGLCLWSAWILALWRFVSWACVCFCFH